MVVHRSIQKPAQLKVNKPSRKSCSVSHRSRGAVKIWDTYKSSKKLIHIIRRKTSHHSMRIILRNMPLYSSYLQYQDYIPLKVQIYWNFDLDINDTVYRWPVGAVDGKMISRRHYYIYLVLTWR